MRSVVVVLGIMSASAGWALAASVDEIPPQFLPFEHMIGGWKGTAAPTANKVKGWSESHGWAWKFEKGKPVGLSVSFDGDKTLAKGVIGYDEATKKYKLDGVDPAGKPATFVGSISTDGKTWTFDRVNPSPEGKERLVVRPTSNKIRYTLQFDRQEPGAPQYKNVITVGLTKEGESFAAGSGGAELPKCIMTGGAAGITVTYMGKSYPVCCSGCRDEFNDNPEKYAKIADLAAQAGGGKEKDKDKAAKPAPKGKDDGSFDGLIDEPKAKTGTMPTKAAAKTGTSSTAEVPPTAETKPAEAKANRDLQLGQNYEKNGKTTSALDQYRKVVKDHPGTEAAKTASARIKALEAK